MRETLDWIMLRPSRIGWLVLSVTVVTVAAIGLATWALIKSVVTEQKVVNITQRIVRLEAPSEPQRQKYLERAIRDLTTQEKQQLLDALLQAATPRQLHRYGLAPFRHGTGGVPGVTLQPNGPQGGASAPQGGSRPQTGPGSRSGSETAPGGPSAPQAPSGGGGSGGGGGGGPPPAPPPPPSPIPRVPLTLPVPVPLPLPQAKVCVPAVNLGTCP